MLIALRWFTAVLMAATLGVTGNSASHAAKPQADTSVDPLDWPNWRGPEQNRVSRETGLVTKWEPDSEENVLWSNPEAAGISTPIVMRGKLYTLVRDQPETTREGEKVLCLDAASGEKLWESRWNVYLSDVPAERIGWSSVVGDPATGNVFAQGVNGYFQCLDGETGKTLWSKSLHEEFGCLSTYGGRTNFPVVFEDMVIVSAVVIGWGEMAKPAHRFIAMDKATGEVRWFNGTTPLPEDTTYSTPTICTLQGQAALVFGSSDGAVWAFQPRTGKPIWIYRMSRRGMNVSPLVVGETIYMTQAEENLDNTSMGIATAFKAEGTGDITKTATIWAKKGVMASKSSPLLVDGRVYVADDSANLYIFEAETGKPVGRPVKLLGTIVRATPLFADGKLYVCSTSAWHVLEPTKSGVKFLDRMRLSEEDEVSASPIVSHGRIYLTTGAKLYCLGEKDAKPMTTPEPLPAPAEESPIEDDKKAAWVQIVPVEMLLKPGDKQRLTVQLFNSRGQLLPGEAKGAQFEISGPGEIASGEFAAPGDAGHSAAIITAKVGELTGQARARIVPPLPWKFDFNKTKLVEPMAVAAKAPASNTPEGEPPITWVGARHRHKIRERDGEKVMVKVTTIPKGTRSQCWMGHVDLHDYTIQADLCGATANDLMPDMGLIAQRYTLDQMGADQKLEIRSWPPQVKTRFSKTVPFEWKPNVWYTMKFRAETAKEGDKAILKGKVWPRDEKEPENWTIEAVDETPNLVGSPGLFGNASNAEIYIDNVMVTAND